MINVRVYCDKGRCTHASYVQIGENQSYNSFMMQLTSTGWTFYKSQNNSLTKACCPNCNQESRAKSERLKEQRKQVKSGFFQK
jgi:hypothetical protein